MHNRSMTTDLNQIELHEDEVINYVASPQVTRHELYYFSNSNLIRKLNSNYE